MAFLLRGYAILTTFAMCVLSPTHVVGMPAQGAHPHTGSPEAILLDATNRDRASAGLPAYQWDESLAASSRKHAEWMAQRRTLSHQFPGEASLEDRATQSGARFSVLAENVAEGPTVSGLETQWMNSPPHRANILADDMNAIGIAVVQSGNTFFAVEDFSQAVPSMDLGMQESQVEQLLASRNMKVVKETSDARQTCKMRQGFAGKKPLAILHYETTDLSRLPQDIDQKLRSGKYHSAAVGACESAGEGFTQFRIAILLFP